MIRSRSAVVVGLALALLGVSRPARGQFYQSMGSSVAAGNIEGFTVAGKGSVSARPEPAGN